MPILRTVSVWHLHCADSEKPLDTSLVAVLVRCLGVGHMKPEKEASALDPFSRIICQAETGRNICSLADKGESTNLLPCV